LLVGLISPSSVVTKLWLPGSPGRIVLAAWWTSASGVNVNCLAEAEGRLPGVTWLARNRTTSRLGCGAISRLLLRCFPRQMTGVGCEPARGSPERSRRAGEAGLAGTGLPNVVPAPKDTDGFTGQPRQCRRPAPAGRQHRDQDDGQRGRENTQARCFLSPSMAQACPEPVEGFTRGSMLRHGRSGRSRSPPTRLMTRRRYRIFWHKSRRTSASRSSAVTAPMTPGSAVRRLHHGAPTRPFPSAAMVSHESPMLLASMLATRNPEHHPRCMEPDNKGIPMPRSGCATKSTDSQNNPSSSRSSSSTPAGSTWTVAMPGNRWR